ncbi:DUF397 domain-containing protein [Streptomyces sp. NBC_00829]|uniref:DUF397 domain-containing protein n=1 Tax=Streptomyces sp. NBC_00829 TaxID=2903679 RepID=UPI003868D4DE|nr:DUF397 domain-containing protein [Streptomyces sp. NBC_00829]
MNTNPPLQWVKSSYSSPEGGNCLEWAPSVAAASGLVPVRDSKNSEGPALTVSADKWSHFVEYAKGQPV